jgi:hypothetical protein
MGDIPREVAYEGRFAFVNAAQASFAVSHWEGMKHLDEEITMYTGWVGFGYNELHREKRQSSLH